MCRYARQLGLRFALGRVCRHRSVAVDASVAHTETQIVANTPVSRAAEARFILLSGPALPHPVIVIPLPRLRIQMPTLSPGATLMS